MTFETFSRCLDRQLSKSQYSSYKNSPKFIQAIHSVFSKETFVEPENKKRVSFGKTVTAHSPSKYSKNRKIKKTSSYSKLKDETINKISLQNFENFFEKFMKNYGEEGYRDMNQEKRKVVRIMETRISDEDEEEDDVENLGSPIPLKAPGRRLKSKSGSKVMSTRRIEGSPRRKEPSPKAAKERVVVFGRSEIREFMIKVWDEMTDNFGVIEGLQDRIDQSPTSTKLRPKGRKTPKSAKTKSRSKKKGNKKKSGSKKVKKKPKNRDLSADKELEKNKKKQLKMKTVDRRAITMNARSKQAFSAKPKSSKPSKQGRVNTSVTKGRLDELISKDRGKMKSKRLSEPSFYHLENLKKKSKKENSWEYKKAIKNFRQGLNFSNFAEKTNVYFKEKLVDRDSAKPASEMVTIPSGLWQNKISKVFKDLSG